MTSPPAWCSAALAATVEDRMITVAAALRTLLADWDHSIPHR
jgi:hypothetical protein